MRREKPTFPVPFVPGMEVDIQDKEVKVATWSIGGATAQGETDTHTPK